MSALNVQDILNLGEFLLVVILMGLAFTAYRTGRHQRLLFVAVAFLLWGVRLGLGVLSSFVAPGIEGANWVELTTTLLDLLTAVLIAIAILGVGQRNR
ncbi:hypothetical protein [Halocalculus aciditolerans]|uniref:Uncharacterized protein n=1 Tax=Halocalculus aciditolerans TaxID=1383812 RepID=A0A830F7T4_9EURY|nr:hypothetical protein [Halocalculus aciditolerans]GGL71686.1 hypothetical protein GCM10009039_32190 [Halocalculus aciditolerans]